MHGYLRMPHCLMRWVQGEWHPPSSSLLLLLSFSLLILLQSCTSSLSQTCGSILLTKTATIPVVSIPSSNFPFRSCGVLSVVCLDNQPITNLRLKGGWRVVGDIKKSTYDNRTLQITPSNKIIFPSHAMTDSSPTYDRLVNAGFFSVSPGYILVTEKT